VSRRESNTPDAAERPELASDLLDLHETPTEPMSPSPEALGVWELAWPTLTASAMQTLVRWVDMKMVGDLGRDAIAGVMAGGQVYWLVQAAAMAVTTGIVALVARATGARDEGLADATLRQGILLGSAFGLASTLLALPFTDRAIGLYGVEPSVVAAGSTYLFWLLVGNVPFTLVFVFSAALRAAGDSRTPLHLGVLANLLHVFLNWVLIYGNLGMPALGVAGAAIASSLAMVFQVAIFVELWRRRRLLLKPTLRGFAPDPGLWRRILRIGYPATLESVMFQLGLLGFMRIMSGYGTAEFAAYNIGAQILALSFLPGFGFATAASTLVGQHLGEGRPALASRSGWRSLAGSIGCMSALGAAIIAAAEPLASWFIDDAEVVALTVDFIWILGVVQPLMAVEYTIGGALRGAGDTRFPLAVVFIGLFLCRLLPAVLAAHWLAASIQIVWSALVLDYAVKAALLLHRFHRGRWQLARV
jgi:putative MATE family efflux protein